jgi:hypothetical protein
MERHRENSSAETLGRGWGIAISEKSGRMIGAMLVPAGAVLIFGTCTES